MNKRNNPSRIGIVLVLLASLLLASPTAQAAPGGNADNSIESRPYTAEAITPAGQEQAELPSMGSYLFKMVLSLAVIFGLSYAGLKIFPRKLSLLPGGDFISVYDQYSLGPNKGIYIAEIGGKVVALGVTDHNISVIAEIADQDLIREMRENLVTSKRPNNWEETKAKLLQSIMGSASPNNQMPFSSHLRQQISKLQDIAQGKVKGAKGKDDTLE